jgi:hypothetical protein
MICPLAFDETVLDLYHVTDAGGMTRVQNESDESERAFFILMEAINRGNMTEAVRVYQEALEERFEAGISYAKDTVDEWHGR